MKLVYFNLRGLAETSRLLFAINHQEYEDFRYPIKVNDWKTHDIVKDEFDLDKKNQLLLKSLNKVPFLTDDGNVICQSKAIERYIARKYNMMGSNLIQGAHIDSICECVRDFKDIYQRVRKTPEDEKESAMKVWFTETLVEKLLLLENILGSDGFSVGNSMSLADVVLYSFITQFFDNKKAALAVISTTPKIQKIIDNVSNNENLKRWLLNRPKTDF